MPMHRRDDRGGGQSGVREVCESLSIDKCHTLCEWSIVRIGSPSLRMLD